MDGEEADICEHGEKMNERGGPQLRRVTLSLLLPTELDFDLVHDVKLVSGKMLQK